MAWWIEFRGGVLLDIKVTVSDLMRRMHADGLQLHIPTPPPQTPRRIRETHRDFGKQGKKLSLT